MLDESFQQLFADHFPDVWRFARRRTPSSEDADDVAAETFAVAWRRRHDLPEDEARPWLFGVRATFWRTIGDRESGKTDSSCGWPRQPSIGL
jgi:hypothetical protein